MSGDREHRRGARKLTAAEVASIRARYAEGELQSVIAAAYAISQTHVSALVRGKRWRELDVVPVDAPLVHATADEPAS